MLRQSSSFSGWNGLSSSPLLPQHQLLHPQQQQQMYLHADEALLAQQQQQHRRPSSASVHGVLHQAAPPHNRHRDDYVNVEDSPSSSDSGGHNKSSVRPNRDPMSHRIIEKRRRDRMNNCLTNLSKLIPNSFLKKGRGRIEKTEIIEMAIRYLKHLEDDRKHAGGTPAIGYMVRPLTDDKSIGTDTVNLETVKSDVEQSVVTEPPASSHPLMPVTPVDLAVTPLHHPHNQQQSMAGATAALNKRYQQGFYDCIAETLRFLAVADGLPINDTTKTQLLLHLKEYFGQLASCDTLGPIFSELLQSLNVRQRHQAVAEPPYHQPLPQTHQAQPPSLPSAPPSIASSSSSVYYNGGQPTKPSSPTANDCHGDDKNRVGGAYDNDGGDDQPLNMSLKKPRLQSHPITGGHLSTYNDVGGGGNQLRQLLTAIGSQQPPALSATDSLDGAFDEIKAARPADVAAMDLSSSSHRQPQASAQQRPNIFRYSSTGSHHHPPTSAVGGGDGRTPAAIMCSSGSSSSSAPYPSSPDVRGCSSSPQSQSSAGDSPPRVNSPPACHGLLSTSTSTAQGVSPGGEHRVVPAFALHQSGRFYVPLSLALRQLPTAVVGRLLSADTRDRTAGEPASCHTVTITVNFCCTTDERTAPPPPVSVSSTSGGLH